jgi:hypothetical protein
MKPLQFVGTCILAIAVLVPLGAPIVPLGTGIMVAAVLNMFVTKQRMR